MDINLINHHNINIFIMYHIKINNHHYFIIFTIFIDN